MLNEHFPTSPLPFRLKVTFPKNIEWKRLHTLWENWASPIKALVTRNSGQEYTGSSYEGNAPAGSSDIWPVQLGRSITGGFLVPQYWITVPRRNSEICDACIHKEYYKHSSPRENRRVFQALGWGLRILGKTLKPWHQDLQVLEWAKMPQDLTSNVSIGHDLLLKILK